MLIFFTRNDLSNDLLKLSYTITGNSMYVQLLRAAFDELKTTDASQKLYRLSGNLLHCLMSAAA
jgi:hypothetical protein